MTYLWNTVKSLRGGACLAVLLPLFALFAGCAERTLTTSHGTPLEPTPAAVENAREAPPGSAVAPGEPSSAENSQDPASTDLSAPAPEVNPDWINSLAPGEPCGTYQHYLAQLSMEGGLPITAVCPGFGACDNASTRDGSIPNGSTPLKTYFLSIHVFCNKNGTNCATTQTVIDDEVAKMNNRYAPWRVRFVYETEFIRDNKYRVLASGDEGMMKHRYAKSPATKLNIYVTDAGGVSWGTFPWWSGALTFTGGIVLDLRHVGGTQNILTHEVGHCIGLWHSFHGVSEVVACSDCYEPAGRSVAQGDVTGDFCSDTAPTLREAYCSDPTSLDPCSGLSWGETPYRNFMGYGNSCTSEFTPQQAGRMHCWTAAVLTGWLR